MSYEHGKENADGVKSDNEQQRNLERSKTIEQRIVGYLGDMEGELDGRSLALAKTNFEQGLMWLNKSICKPESKL